MIRLRPMTIQEFDDFYEYSREHHSKELMREQNMSPDEAYNETEKELLEMLPEGPGTKDNHLMAIEELSDHRTVGFIWYLSEMTDGIRQSFLCDFVISEQERRKGYASAALSEMEKHAVSLGCKESVLFVANDNPAARKLYDRCGYIFLKDSDYGMFLKKEL